MNLYEETRFLIKKYNVTANKKLGQNFLIDEEVVNKIIQKSDIKETDLVIEIGPGLGTLTRPLLEKAKKVICVELDYKMLSIIEDRFKLYDNFELINDDILKVDLNSIISNTKKEYDDIKQVKIVANLPYYITTPIIMRLLEENLDIDSITVMIQKEVADRLAETPGGKNTGAITYSVYYYANTEKVCFVPKQSFIPQPEVNSEVIKLEIRKKPIINTNKELLFAIIKSAFMQRRKTLVNALSSNDIFKNMSKSEIESIVRQAGVNEKTRGEKLSIEDYNRIVKILEARGIKEK